jgi:peptidoglycan/xylan/chitin deacetylase (PgdA/CDA1 family)
MMISSIIKNSLKRALVHSNIMLIAARYAKTGVTILRYHSVQQTPDDIYDTIGIGITHSKRMFREQMQFLAKHCNPVSMDDVLEFLQGERSLPNKAIAVTFDDGFEDNYTVAAPILNELGIPATFYVLAGAVNSNVYPWYMRLRYAFANTDRKSWINKDGIELKYNNSHEREFVLYKACEQCGVLSGKDQYHAVEEIEKALNVEPYTGNNLMLKWEQIISLHQKGHIIGSHTISHPNLAYVNDNDLEAELRESKALLEKKLGNKVRHFGYPSPILQPHWSEHTREVTKKVGYETAVTCTSGKVEIGDNPLSIKRIWTPFDMQNFCWYLENTLLGRSL